MSGPVRHPPATVPRVSRPSDSGDPALPTVEIGSGSGARPGRVQGIDVARGVASLIMIQGHAYDGWVSAEGKDTAAYAFTRLLGSLPLPAFLVLAGAAIVLRVDAARRRGEDAGAVRRAVMRRGAVVVGWGYLANGAYALMDGWEGLDTFLRADVLHVIGVSIVALAFFGIRGARAPEPRAMVAGAAALLVVPTLVCPWLSPLGADVEGPARFAVALFVDVPGVTTMPFVPLVSWLALGALTSLWLLRARARAPGPKSPAGAPDGTLLALAGIALLAATLGAQLTTLMVRDLGGSLSRAHPAVWMNVVDLGARGVLVLALAASLTTRLPARVRDALIRLGRGSLVAYVFHIPFCYGRLGAPLRDRLDMPTATVLVVLLMLASGLAVSLRDALRRRAPKRAI